MVALRLLWGMCMFYGGCGSTCPLTTVRYAPICTGINSSATGCSTTAGPTGTWIPTISLPSGDATEYGNTNNGYIYYVGGCTSGCGGSTPVKSQLFTIFPLIPLGHLAQVTLLPGKQLQALTRLSFCKL